MRVLLATTVACLLLIGVAAGPGKEEQVQVGDSTITFKVLGKSGKMRVSYGNNSKAMTVEFDDVQEVDSNGDSVGGNTHGFNSFASKDFTFTSTADVVYLGIPAKNFNFTATNLQSSGVGSIKVSTYLFTEDGEIEIGVNETQDVESGMLKFNVEIVDWEFCDGTVTTSGQPGYCKKGGSYETGAYLDFVILVKGLQDTKADKTSDSQQQVGGRKKPEKYSFGDGIILDMSTQVNKDGVWEEMATGYPATMLNNKKTKFTLRFPKFTNYAFYDPSMYLGANAAIRVGSSAVALLFITLLSVFLSW